MVTMVSGGNCGGSVINGHSWWSFLFYVLFFKSLTEIWKLQLKFQVESWKSKISSFFLCGNFKFYVYESKHEIYCMSIYKF